MNTSFDSSDDGGGRSELFTPMRGRRTSLVQDFTPTPSASTAEESTPVSKAKKQNSGGKTGFTDSIYNKSSSFFADDSPNTLPKLQDKSWLGADVSPIRKGDGDILEDIGEDEDSAVVAPYRLGLMETTASSSSSVAASESIFLPVGDDMEHVGRNNSKEQTPRSTKNKAGDGSKATQNSSMDGNATSSKWYLRPRFTFLGQHWATATTDSRNDLGTVREMDNIHQRRRRRLRWFNLTEQKLWTFWYWNVVNRIRRGNLYVIGATAFFLFCVGIHDGFLGYLAMRKGIADSGLAWTLPWIGPTQRSLLRFGAFCPERLLRTSSSTSSPQYWRSFTSMFLPISLVEWLLLVWVWTMYLPSRVFSRTTKFSWQLSWPVVYTLSAWTGQLWMVAFHYEIMKASSWAQQDSSYGSSLPALSGCAGWATAGVLCAVGIQAPNRRFPCFVSSIVLVVLHQCKDTGSVIGCSAATFFGWAYSGLWSLSPRAIAGQQQQERDYTYYHDLIYEGGFTVDESRRWTLWHVLAAIVVFLLWFSPIVFLLFR